ncbi:MAG TPA: M13 family metallopeptidase [Pyrinomonadaceae bacterium]|jgi:putative endopeptidase
MKFAYFRPAIAFLIVTAIFTTTFGQSAGKKGPDLASLDRSCKPCEDFYKYANGGWLNDSKNQIPAAYSSWGKANILADNNSTALKQIVEESAKNTAAPKGGTQKMVGDLYTSCMDEARIEAAGAKPLAANLTRIEAIRSVSDLAGEVGRMHREGFPVLFGLGAGPDLKNSTIIIAQTGQGGLSLPNRDYYTNQDEKSKEIREALVKHIARMFELLGDDSAKAAAAAQTVLTIQTKLAEASKAPVQLRDPNANYNKFTFAQLKELTPDWSWDAYLAARNAPKINEINVAQPEFFKEVNRLAIAVSLDDWKTLLRWHLVSTAASRMSKKFDDEKFNFNRVFSGQKEQLPREKRCVSTTDGLLGDALGQEFVKRTFPPASKARMKEMVNNLTAAFRERLLKLDWMSDETRKQALVKLDAIVQKIGYPDKWESFDGLKISRESFFDNTLQAIAFHGDKNLQKIGKPVDRTEWAMTVPTVNAYYSSLLNEIVFPAGILQPPMFDPNADDAINYGAIGAVIGHEITHGFDDKGSLFDAKGNLRMWWTPEDRAKFDQRAECIVKQYNSYQVADDLFINGKLTLGENIGDLGGLTVAYEAYMKSLSGKPRVEIDGFTPEQRFFLGYAQAWVRQARAEFERNYVKNDVHSLPRFRVLGPLSNMPQFAAAFNCKPGDKMVRPESERCQIW